MAGGPNSASEGCENWADPGSAVKREPTVHPLKLDFLKTTLSMRGSEAEDKETAFQAMLPLE